MFTGDDATADDAATTHRRIDGHWARNEAGVSDARRWRSPLLPSFPIARFLLEQ